MAKPIIAYAWQPILTVSARYSDIFNEEKNTWERKEWEKREILIVGENDKILGTLLPVHLLGAYGKGQGSQPIGSLREYFQKPVIAKASDIQKFVDALNTKKPNEYRSVFVLNPKFNNIETPTANMVHNEITDVEAAKMMEVFLFGDPPHLPTS